MVIVVNTRDSQKRKNLLSSDVLIFLILPSSPSVSRISSHKDSVPMMITMTMKVLTMLIVTVIFVDNNRKYEEDSGTDDDWS